MFLSSDWHLAVDRGITNAHAAIESDFFCGKIPLSVVAWRFAEIRNKYNPDRDEKQWPGELSKFRAPPMTFGHRQTMRSEFLASLISQQKDFWDDCIENSQIPFKDIFIHALELLHYANKRNRQKHLFLPENLKEDLQRVVFEAAAFAIEKGEMVLEHKNPKYSALAASALDYFKKCGLTNEARKFKAFLNSRNSAATAQPSPAAL